MDKKNKASFSETCTYWIFFFTAILSFTVYQLLWCDISNDGGKSNAQAKVEDWNRISDKDASAYDISYGVGRYRYHRSLAVSDVYRIDDSVVYEVIGEGTIVVKNGVAEWLHDDDSIEIISNVVILKSK